MKNRKFTKRFTALTSLILALLTLGSCGMAKGGAADGDMNYAPMAPSMEANGNNYQFDEVIENNFTTVTEASKTSTFSLDRNTASYALMRSQINQGLKINKESVRIEEYINYFSYGYDEPDNNAALDISGELIDCPWNPESKLLSVGIAAETIDFQDAKPNNIVFLLDVSGSMYGADRLGLIQQAFTMLLEHLDDDDTVSIVTYAGDTRTLLEGGRGYEKTKIAAILQDLEASGGTAGSKGIELAYNAAAKFYSPEKNNRVILATDGDFNLGIKTDSGLKKFISEKRESGIYLSVLGVGMGNTNDSFMKTLAENGNGNYAVLDSVSEARKVLVEELGGTMNVVAKNAKINVTFNEQTVEKFRLIGYETKMMTEDEFNDVNKDAGEIGSGHTVTALYELKLKDGALDLGTNAIAAAEIRYQTPEEQSINLSITEIFTAEDYSASPDEDEAFIACVAEYGLLLRQSEYKENASYESLISRLEQLECVRENEFKKEFLEIVKKAKIIAEE